MAGVEQSTDRTSSARDQRFARIVGVALGVGLIGLGAWAFLAPRPFFDAIAVFKPYNEHFVHDLGALQIGLGAVLLLGVYLSNALLVALSGVGVGAALHALSHVIDRDAGGRPAVDIPLFTLLALLLIAAAVTEARNERNGPKGRADQ